MLVGYESSIVDRMFDTSEGNSTKIGGWILSVDSYIAVLEVSLWWYSALQLQWMMSHAG